jgi:predicted nucleic acid-binding protein
VPPEAPGYLVDSNVLSNRRDALLNPNVKEWLRRNARLIRISVVTLAEIHRGLLLLQVKATAAPGKAKARLTAAHRSKRAWYDEVLDLFGDRIEPIDLGVAQKWAEVSVRFPSLRDGDKAIAATALAKGYGVATRNLVDFRQAGVPLVNPYDSGTWDDGWDDDPVSTLLRG